MATRHPANLNNVDLGGALAANQSGDPSKLVGILNKLNLPLTQQTTEWLGDVQDMQVASGRTGLLNGFALPAGADSRNDFFALMTTGEQFAAASGWQYFLTPMQMRWGVEHGVSQMTSQQQWSWMAGLNPQTQSMPWLNAGMSQQAYHDYSSRLGDVWSQYTGDNNAPSDLMAQAARENWSAQRFQQHIQNDPGITGKYGWIAHGMTYNDFQQYKLSNKQQAAQRFGASAGDSQYLTMLKDPLTQYAAQGASLQQSSSQLAQNNATGFGRQSEAR